MSIPRITLKPREERRITGSLGHPWIFSNEIASFSDDANASLVEVYAGSGQLIGLAFYNPKSLIAGRLIAREKLEINIGFWKKRMLRAWALRLGYYPGAVAFRWIFGESDGIPGLIVDRYGDYLALEVLAKALEAQLSFIVAALLEIFPAKGVLLRRDNALRKLEGLEMGFPFVLEGALPQEPLAVVIDGLAYRIDFWQGHKTGFYLDQRDNRIFLKTWAPGKRVLDLFSYTGSFGLSLASAGAGSVTCVDSSERAVSLGREQAQANNLEGRLAYVAADVEGYLESITDEFDMVLADPPNLVPAKKDAAAASRKFIRLFAAGMEHVAKGGLLAASCCSFHIDVGEFLRILREAARQSQRVFRVLAVRHQALDHPILLHVPETHYLKFVLLERV